MLDQIKEIELLIKSRYGIILVESYDSYRIEQVLKLLSNSLKIFYFRWTITNGLYRVDIENAQAVYKTEDLESALKYIKSSHSSAIFQLEGVAQDLADKKFVSLLRDISLSLTKKNSAIIITSSTINVPSELKEHCAYVKLNEPELNEYDAILEKTIRELKSRMAVAVNLSPEERQSLLNNLKGLTLAEAEKVISKLIIEDSTLCPKDIGRIKEIKKQLVSHDGIIEFYSSDESFSNIADLKTLKSWLNKRKEIILRPESAAKFGLTFPKGILLIGVPGCGKSFCAKVISAEWNLPLLKMNTANLYNKYIGESEKNLRQVIKLAESLSPVVLWIDEIEKAFANSQEDGGTSSRIFGSFLSWMQDRKSEVFVVATANDISSLPPEFLRKGRFDEIFFVDLPDLETRREIFSIHLKKRNQKPENINLEALALETQGFSGSEIEQVIVSSLYTAFSNKNELSDEIILKEIKSTIPLSVTMAEKIDELRVWAKDRSVIAH